MDEQECSSYQDEQRCWLRALLRFGGKGARLGLGLAFDIDGPNCGKPAD